MPDLTAKQKNAEKQRRFRLRQREAGRHEVRGIYATPDERAKIKAYAKRLIQAIKPLS